MKPFWLTFWATLAAILAAGALIGLFIENKSRSDALAETKAKIAALEAKIAKLKKDRRDQEAFKSPTPQPSTLQP